MQLLPERLKRVNQTGLSRLERIRQHLPEFYRFWEMQKNKGGKTAKGKKVKDGLIYGIADKQSIAVKIGWTTYKKASDRKDKLQDGNPNELTLVFESKRRYVGFYYIEQYVHECLNDFRSKRGGGSEWFELTEKEAIDFLSVFFDDLDFFLSSYLDDFEIGLDFDVDLDNDFEVDLDDDIDDDFEVDL